MSSKFRLVTVAALTSLGLIVTPLAPAYAAGIGLFQFRGKCILSQHIAAPHIGKKPGAITPVTCNLGMFSGKFNPAATPEPEVWIAVQVPILKKGKPKPIFTSCIKAAQNDSCTVLTGSVQGGATVTSSVRPFLFAFPACGSSQSGPPGSVTINTAPQPQTISGSFMSAGTVLIVTGTWTHGLQSGPFLGFVNALPAVQMGDSCVSKPPGARRFNVQGFGFGGKVGPLNNPLPFIDPK